MIMVLELVQMVKIVHLALSHELAVVLVEQATSAVQGDHQHLVVQVVGDGISMKAQEQELLDKDSLAVLMEQQFPTVVAVVVLEVLVEILMLLVVQLAV